MGKINVLSFEIANLIAAGEVVERPSSVLKELIENSIDAGATKIIAEIKRGGVALIRVTDNGCGMSREDLPVSLKRHATSKIHERDDLSKIMTLGFRGEALAAISSVSCLTVITKTKDASSASMLTAEAGNVTDISEVGAADGTTVVVENLFYNVPARRKFLKKDATEAMNVAALVERVALSRPDISIQLLVDGEEKFRTPGDGDLLRTITSVYGRDFASKLLPVEGSAGGIRVHGFIGRSDNVRKNRNLENVFINGRYVKSLTVTAALEKAFVSFIAPECFPSCVLLLDMSPDSVDVNVHPAKLEVKFSDERPVFEAVYHTVRAKLEEGGYRPDMIAASAAAQKEARIRSAFVPLGEKTAVTQVRMETAPKTTPPPFLRESAFGASKGKSVPEPTVSAEESVDILAKYSRSKPEGNILRSVADGVLPSDGRPSCPTQQSANIRTSPAQMPAEPTELPTDPEAPPYRLVGEAFDCYVMVETEGELLVIDKHAAHERILFEQLKKDREKDGRVCSQELLLPLTAELTEEEISAADQYRADIESVGFSFALEERGAQITAIPDAISSSDATELFIRMTDELAGGRGNPALTEQLRREKALYQIACKAAIKGGRQYDESVIRWLVGKVLTLPNITVCPHGRPIAYRVGKRELDRRFDRIK